MAQIRHDDPAFDTPTQEEITAMADLLARRHAEGAVEVALHFAAEHDAVNDERRAAVWYKVASRLLDTPRTPTLS